MAISPSFVVLLSAFIFSQVYAVNITPDIDPPGRYLNTGEKVFLECTTEKSGATLKWTWLDAFDNSTKDALEVPGVSAVGKGSIKIEPVSGKIGGNYTCSDGSESATTWINVLDADSLIPRDVLQNGTHDTVILRCHQRIEPARRLPLIWTRVVKGEEVILNDIEGKGDDTFKVFANDGYLLKMKNPNRKRYPLKTGEYRCRFNASDLAASGNARSGGGPLEQTVSYQTTPDIRIEGVSAASSKSATKDEPGTLTCVYNSYDAKTYATWSYKNDSHGENASFSLLVNEPFDNLPDCQGADSIGKKCVGNYTFTRSESIENDSLKNEQHERTLILNFDNVRDTDSGKYICQVHEYDAVKRQWNVNEAAVQLKVKDKLAALWPFLGIVAEVVVLCAIIFIYEKRRNKTVEDEDESEPMKGNVHETTDSVVRSRKA